MGGWTLEDVASLDLDAYLVLVEWIKETTSPRDGSMDMDEYVKAVTKADA